MYKCAEWGYIAGLRFIPAEPFRINVKLQCYPTDVVLVLFLNTFSVHLPVLYERLFITYNYLIIFYFSIYCDIFEAKILHFEISLILHF